MLSHFDHALLKSSSLYGFTKFLNWFFRSLHHFLEIYLLNIEENLTAFFEIFLYLKNNDSVEHV